MEDVLILDPPKLVVITYEPYGGNMVSIEKGLG